MGEDVALKAIYTFLHLSRCASYQFHKHQCTSVLSKMQVFELNADNKVGGLFPI